MRLRPGLNYNFTVLELDAMLLELFKRDPQHPFMLARGVFHCAIILRLTGSAP